MFQRWGRLTSLHSRLQLGSLSWYAGVGCVGSANMRHRQHSSSGARAGSQVPKLSNNISIYSTELPNRPPLTTPHFLVPFFLDGLSNIGRCRVAYFYLRFERGTPEVPVVDIAKRLRDWGMEEYTDEKVEGTYIYRGRKASRALSPILFQTRDPHGNLTGKALVKNIHSTQEFSDLCELIGNVVGEKTTVERVKVPIDEVQSTLETTRLFKITMKTYGFRDLVDLIKKLRPGRILLSDDERECFRDDVVEMLAKRENIDTFWTEKTATASVPGIVPAAPPPPAKASPVGERTFSSAILEAESHRKKASVRMFNEMVPASSKKQGLARQLVGRAKGLHVDETSSTVAPEHVAVCSLLLPFVPSLYFIPLLEVAKKISIFTIEEIAKALQQPLSPLPDQSEARTIAIFDFLIHANVLGKIEDNLISVRILGSSPSDVFVRMVGKGVPFLNLEEHQDLEVERRSSSSSSIETGGGGGGGVVERRGDSTPSKYFISREAALRIHSHLLGTYHGGPRRGFTVDQLKQIPKPEITYSLAKLDEELPSELFSEIPVQGPASLLIFDRLPHLFEVNPETYQIRPRPIVGCDSDGNLIHFHHHNTPCPRLVRYFDSLSTAVSSVDLEEKLSSALELELKFSVQSINTFLLCHPSTAYYRRPDSSTESNSVITTGNIERKEAILAYSSTENRAARLREDNLKQFVMDVDRLFAKNKTFRRGVTLYDLRKTLKAVGKTNSYRFAPQVRPQFWYDEWERVGHYKLRNKLYFDKNHASLIPGTTPESELPVLYAKENVVTLEDFLEQVAEACVAGWNYLSSGEMSFVSEAQLTQSMSLIALTIIRRYGNIGEILSLVPEWFIVKEGRSRGSSMVLYIGHLSEEEKAVQRLKANAV